MVDWLNKALNDIKEKRREGQKYSIKSNDIKFEILSNAESFIKTGVLRVLYCLKMIPNGLRYTELEELTGLPRSTLLKVIKHLKSFDVITTKDMDVKEPRKDTVPFYILTKKGYHFTEDFFFVTTDIFEKLFYGMKVKIEDQNDS